MEAKDQKEIYEQFLDEFAKEFSKKKNWYRFGEMSGKIMFKRQTYGEIADFVRGLKNSQVFYEVFITEASQDQPPKLDYSTAIALWDYIFKHHENQIEHAIMRENGLKNIHKNPNLTIKTYNFEGKEVVFLSFYQACYNDTDYYAVPRDVALELCVEDYMEQELSRYDDLWEHLEPYKIEDDFVFKGTCIRTYNYD